MIGLRLLAVLLLVGVNGFFATAEFSLVAVRASRVRQLLERGDARARIVQQLLGQLDRVVSGVQVGITLTSLAIGALGEPVLAQIFRPMLDWLPGSRAALVAHGVAVVLAFAFLTVLHVVFGELVPKTISLEHAGRAALLIARPFYWYLTTFRWAVVLLEGFSRKVVRALGVTGLVAGHTVPHSAEELQVQIRQAAEHGLLAPGEERVILGALELRQVRVREIMVPRPDVHALADRVRLRGDSGCFRQVPAFALAGVRIEPRPCPRISARQGYDRRRFRARAASRKEAPEPAASPSSGRTSTSAACCASC